MANDLFGFILSHSLHLHRLNTAEGIEIFFSIGLVLFFAAASAAAGGKWSECESIM